MGCASSRTTQPTIIKGFLIEKLEIHGGGINCTALSEDYSLLATGSEDETVNLWSTQSTPVELLGTLQGHTSYVTHAVVHGNYVVTASADKTLKKWSIVDARCVYTYHGHTARVNRVLCTGDFVFSTSHDKTAIAWHFSADVILQEELERQMLAQVSQPEPVGLNGSQSQEEDPESDDNGDDNEEEQRPNIVITGSHDCTARTWDLYSCECLKVLKGHTAPINAMAVDSEGRLLFTGGGDGVIRSWYLKSGECQRVLTGHQGAIVCLLAHGRMLYSGSSDHTARAWVMEFGECTRVYRGHHHTVDCIRYHDRMLYTGSGDKVARMYEAKSGTLKRSFRGHENGVVCIEVVDGRLFTGSYDGAVFVWDTTGVIDETVFGEEDLELEEEELPEDSDEVKKAVNFLEPFIHEG
ncbi:WD repeat-containing protein 86-like [Ornithodoros turicata]|uniref:WD repeat-containing protein 86-like n=1 Tax=Ornithodoros turicata TaxID=34597 RepID=UPI0031390898